MSTSTCLAMCFSDWESNTCAHASPAPWKKSISLALKCPYTHVGLEVGLPLVQFCGGITSNWAVTNWQGPLPICRQRWRVGTGTQARQALTQEGGSHNHYILARGQLHHTIGIFRRPDVENVFHLLAFAAESFGPEKH